MCATAMGQASYDLIPNPDFSTGLSFDSNTERSAQGLAIHKTSLKTPLTSQSSKQPTNSPPLPLRRRRLRTGWWANPPPSPGPASPPRPTRGCPRRSSGRRTVRSAPKRSNPTSDKSSRRRVLPPGHRKARVSARGGRRGGGVTGSTIGRARALAAGGAGGVVELEDQRAAGDDARASGQEVASYDVLEDAALARALRTDDDDLREVDGGLSDRAEDVLQLVDYGNQVFHRHSFCVDVGLLLPC